MSELQATGIVIGHAARGNGIVISRLLYPVVTFETQERKTVEFESSLGSNMPPQIGEEVTVSYDLSCPQGLAGIRLHGPSAPLGDTSGGGDLAPRPPSAPGDHRAELPPLRLAWEGSVLLDGSRSLHELYGARAESLYLIRPDGYVGFRGQPVGVEPLIEYLRSKYASALDGEAHVGGVPGRDSRSEAPIRG